MALLELLVLSVFLLVPLLLVLALMSIRIVNQYERAVLFTLGRFSQILPPGLNFVIPFLQTSQKVDVRTVVVNIPKQDTMTKDNVSVQIDAVIYYRVSDPQAAVIQVEDYSYATLQLAQTTLRQVVGEITLDDLLGKRDTTAKLIQEIIGKSTGNWGIRIDNVEIKDIQLPADLIRIIAKEAEAEREKRAVVIKASGELEAAKSLAKAAKALSAIPGGLHIRMLQTINNLGNEKSMTRVITTPSELLNGLFEYLKRK